MGGESIPACAAARNATSHLVGIDVTSASWKDQIVAITGKYASRGANATGVTNPGKATGATYVGYVTRTASMGGPSILPMDSANANAPKGGKGAGAR